MDENTVKRFWNKVDVRSKEECWNWTASKIRGYGQMSKGKNKSPYRAHRLSWMINRGEIKDNLHVLHHCDNPSCVNPNHLFLGTQQDNMKDMVSKNRQQRVSAEKATGSKLTWKNVNSIRSEYENGGVSMKDLAIKYGVWRATISSVLRNKSWIDKNYIVPEEMFGSSLKNDRVYRRKIRNWQVAGILEDYEKSGSSRKTAKKYGVSKTTILKLKKGI